MIKNIILAILILPFGLLISSLILWFLFDKKVRLWQAVKLVGIAGAMNKLLLTGSGYAAMCWKLKDDNFSFARAFSSFMALELISLLPWLILGFYFGAKINFRSSIFLIIILALTLFCIIYKRREISNYLKEVWKHFRRIRFNFILVFPLSLANVMLVVIYYFFIFGLFGISLNLLDILKIVSVSFILGYLSPFPSGLGVKEGSLIYLLTRQGVSFGYASGIAIIDRLIISSFYASLGFLFGAKIIKDEIGRRFTQSKGKITLWYRKIYCIIFYGVGKYKKYFLPNH